MYTGTDGELIDTLWNVNDLVDDLVIVAKSELIDTLWNVNAKEYLKTQHLEAGINRYIMECKWK